MSRPIKNRSVYYSKEHKAMLYYFARKIARQYDGRLEPDDLAHAAWYSMLRYHKSVRGKGSFLAKTMCTAARKILYGKYGEQPTNIPFDLIDSRTN